MPIAARTSDRQTLMKTILAPGLKSRSSASAAGSPEHPRHRDGEVLDDPTASRQGGLEAGVLRRSSARLYPSSTARCTTRFASSITRRARPKEGWDNIDILWVARLSDADQDRFLGRDSILAADRPGPRAIHGPRTARWLGGIQEWLSFYYKSPLTAPGCTPRTTCSFS